MSKFKDFSVLMSVYKNDDVNQFNQAMDSLFDNTVLPKQIVLVEDGPLPDELQSAIKSYIDEYAGVFKVIKLHKNMGLGAALAAGQSSIKYEYVARVDSDDINMPHRFETQLSELQADASLGVVGSQLREFDDDGPQKRRIVPNRHNDIVKRAQLRSPMNHTTVMFRTSALMSCGGYRNATLFEDYDLWMRLIKSGYHFQNNDDILVWARISDGMFKRRGGISYLKKYVNFRLDALRHGRVSVINFVLSLGIYATSMMMPNQFRKLLYQRVLRRE
ncbi:glycosyltransferase [Weissella cibaria]|uniref:glycosyltransferase n=1 Tax=Weissella cibaria TaxID=137591 RepID=UPI00223A7B5B|nr:glycosyltransferase [Weissella cibaria]